jgi:mono/diheme cytochrome c family protein
VDDSRPPAPCPPPSARHAAPSGTRAATRAFAAAALAAAAIAIGGCSREVPEAQRIAVGQQVYVDYCAGCHGASLEGQPEWRQRRPDGRLPAPPHDASGHTWHHSDRDLFEITKYGVQRFAGPGYASDMPAFEGILSDEQIRSVLAYIRSTWPEPIRERQAQIDRRGR